VKTDIIDDELCALHVRVPRATEAGLKAIARAERESMATVIRMALRQTVARGGVENVALLAAAVSHPSTRESIEA
jgi:predicted transcriptional regulator